MDSAMKRRLRDHYKAKPAVGGVYCMECSDNHRRCVKATEDIGGIRNRFRFSQSIGGCPDPVFQSEWTQYGSASFTLTVLEELTRKEDQTDDEFSEDVRMLLELWQEKLASEGAEGGARA